MPRLADARQDLTEAMERQGEWPERAPWIRQAAEALPREEFAPDRVWRWDGHAYVPVDREADPDGWAAEIYPGPGAATVTQVLGGEATSSLSAEGVVANMLDSLLLEPGHRVLELGTGAGRNAALAAWRAGPGLVTSVEVDEDLTDAARERIKAAGQDVTVVVGDGADGWAPGAPYDRVIATYAVETVPWAWVAQTRPGGRIVTPWGRLGEVSLKVAADGRSASGWVQGLAQFMPSRATSPVPGYQEVRGEGLDEDERLFTRDVAALDNGHLLFALRVLLPEVLVTTRRDDDGPNAWLHDGAKSWAALCAQGDGRTVAYQGGPRRLADELEEAWTRWDTADQPDQYDFGMTVKKSGRQTVWCRDNSTAPWWESSNPSTSPS
ncbi:methyltransferase domain-containing protein [Streptomyces sp. NPDC091278]|uniref:methyltransferase domain-containing protein n=1 Tax=Streptomyces sp. NPDC091278 TaxID=3155301 RepID=UPI00344FD6C0